MKSHPPAREACYQIDLTLTGQQRHCEIIPDNLDEAVCLLEEMCALELENYFACVLIDEVSLNAGPSARPDSDEPAMTIHLCAQGIQPLLITAHLDLLIESILTCALAQIFEALHVERCAVA